MQEIAPRVYIEDSYRGVVLGAVNIPRGLILIDAPLHPDDINSWRSALLNMGGGVNPLLVNLDAHCDRTIGSRNMECTVVGHRNNIQLFHDRPISLKSQATDTGSEWEEIDGLGSVRWAPPELSFTDKMEVHCGDGVSILFEYHPGPTAGSIWVILPEQGVIFLGDTVVSKQPPLLADADLTAWIDALKLLTNTTYKNYLLVGGRNGLVTISDVQNQTKYLRKVNRSMQSLARKGVQPEDTERLIPNLLSGFGMTDQYYKRLKYGLSQYYKRHYFSDDE